MAATRSIQHNDGLEDQVDAFREMGIDEDEITRWRETMEDAPLDDFEVCEEDWDTLLFFLAMTGLWERHPLDGTPLNFKPSAIERRMRIMKRKHDIELYDTVMLMGQVAAGELRNSND